MGFWSTVGDITVGLAKEVKKKGDIFTNLKQEYADKSDSYVARKCKNGSSDEKIAARSVLKERGHDTESIQRMIMDS